MIEIWKDVIGYEGIYQVSNLGRVKALQVTTNHNGKSYTRKERIISPGFGNGYLRVCLRNGNAKMFLVHRLVAQAFIPNPNKYPCVNHKDENKTNNSVDNLEWCTHAYNDNYGSRNYKLHLSGLGKHPSENTIQKLKDYYKIHGGTFLGRHHTQSTKDIISKKLKENYANGFKHPMLGVHRLGKDAPRYGATLSEDTKQKISESVRLYDYYQYDLITGGLLNVFTSMNSIYEYLYNAKITTASKSSVAYRIYATMSGKQSAAYGFKWVKVSKEEVM